MKENGSRQYESRRNTESKHKTREDRIRHLESVRITGFESEESKAWVTNRIVDTGLPVDNIRSLRRERNRWGSETTLGSWGVGISNGGEFSVYELLDRQIPEKQFGTIAHEGAHANSPFVEINDFVFRSQEARVKAARHATLAAQQTKETGRFLNGYHKHLFEQLESGEINESLFAEETWAIMSELALTNRKKLAQVEQAQHAVLERRRQAGETVMDSVQLLTLQSDDPDKEAMGVDRALVALISEVDNQEGLEKHVEGLKEKFYPEENIQIVIERRKKS